MRPPRAPLVRRVMPEPQVVAAPLRVADQRARLVVPIPKGPELKHGKYTPNAEERAWMDWIVGYGCVACRADGLGVRPAAVHHILSGGRRMGHLFTLPLCDPGHHQGGQPLGMVSRHPWKTRFEQRYGAELFILLGLQQLKTCEEMARRG